MFFDFSEGDKNFSPRPEQRKTEGKFTSPETSPDNTELILSDGTLLPKEWFGLLNRYYSEDYLAGQPHSVEYFQKNKAAPGQPADTSSLAIHSTDAEREQIVAIAQELVNISKAQADHALLQMAKRAKSANSSKIHRLVKITAHNFKTILRTK